MAQVLAQAAWRSSRWRRVTEVAPGDVYADDGGGFEYYAYFVTK